MDDDDDAADVSSVHKTIKICIKHITLNINKARFGNRIEEEKGC